MNAIEQAIETLRENNVSLILNVKITDGIVVFNPNGEQGLPYAFDCKINNCDLYNNDKLMFK